MEVEGKALRIRPCKESDLRKVYEIEKASFKDAYPYWLLKFYYVLSPETFLVAEVEGRVVGYVIGILERERLGHIISIAVSPDFRGMGIGRELLEGIIVKLRNKGAESIRLEVRPSNKQAIALYRSVGFNEVSIIPNYYEDGEPCIVMELVL